MRYPEYTIRRKSSSQGTNVLGRIFLAVFTVFLLTASVDNNRAVEANRAYEAGEYARAETIYRELLEEQPDTPQLLFNLGNTLAQQGKTEASIETFNRYREVTPAPPERAPAEYNLGVLHEEMENTEEALRHFRHAIEYQPDDEDAKYNYELLKRRQQQTPPDEDQQDEEQQQQPEPESGQSPPPSDDQSSDQDEETRQQQTPVDEPPEAEEQRQGDLSDISSEQLEHAEEIMNALEQIEKDLIKDFKKRQFDPVDPHEKDW